MAYYDIALSNKTHDITIKNNDFMLISNAERVAQQIKIALLEWQGEWFLDSRDGVPYLEYILIKNYNLYHIRSVLISAIAGVDGVNSVESLTASVDNQNRILTVTYTADTDYGLVTNKEVLGYGN
ncbi:hypothetical protein [Pectinatus frisingensis]|uniref:hypothetical protein n=1 Tax=Pectinatus frisingensis TaxID=865 RepID=UPI0018C5B7DB|nr:hypothetical protein [Pectinatus frisingensis]